MKKLFSLGIILMMLVLCTCSKDDTFVSNSSGQDDLLKKAHKGAVFTVSPSGGDDTQAFKDAFDDAKAAGPGSVVQMEAGQYNIQPIEVRDFNGYFRGAGTGNTTISNWPDIPCNDFWAVDNCPYLMQFVAGNITISDMTFQLNDGCPCAGPQWNYEIFGDLLVSVLVLTDYTLSYMPNNRYIKGVVKDVNFVGGNLCAGGTDPYGRNVNTNMTIYIGAPWWIGTENNILSDGEITVTGCRFERGTVGPDVAQFSENSKIVIENNYISECIYGIYSFANLGPQFSVKNNQFQNNVYYDIVIDDNDYGYYPNLVLQQRTEWNIAGNNFQSLPGVTNLFLGDFRRTLRPDEGFPQLFDIKGNTFITQEGGMAIYSLNNVGAKILNNKFTGVGSVGVMIDGDAATGTWAERNCLIGNNYFGANYTDAAVYLGPYSRNCKVVGVAADQVLDEGVNNTVVGTKAQKKGVQANEYLQHNLRNIHEKFMRRGRL
jgi:hypothetical protein